MILAIVPAIPLLVLLFGGGGLAAWLLGKKKKGAADPGKLPAPTVDPVPVPGRKPFLTLMSGTTVAELRKNGATWNFTVQGAAPATGGDEDAGAAAVQMAQAFATSSPTGNVTGQAGSATSETLDLSVQQDQDVWDWAVTGPSKLPYTAQGPQPPVLLEGSTETSRSRAILRVLAALGDHLDWLSVPNLEGGGAPQPTPPNTSLPGLVITGTSVAVVNLAKWIAHAAPLIRADFEQNLSADQIMDAFFGDAPDDAKVDGKSIKSVRDKVQDVIASIYDKKYLHKAPADEKVAAMIVGRDLDPEKAHVSRYHEHVILARPVKAAPGGIAIPGDQFEYLIWEGDMRGYDADAKAQKTMAAGKTRNATIRAAKDLIDGVEPFVLVNPEVLELNPKPEIFDVNPAAFAPPDPIDWSPKAKSYNITATSWRTRTIKDMKVFDFRDGEHAKRKDWTLGIGICVTRSGSSMPFGDLSEALTGGGSGIGDFSDPMARFLIRNVAGEGGIGGIGVPVKFETFATPLAFKAQFVAKFERGATIRIVKALEDVTDTDNGHEIGVCNDLEHQWPQSAEDDGFLVLPAAQDVWQPWAPTPRFKLIHEGPTLVLRMSIAGFPVFADSEGGMSPALEQNTPFKIAIKVWASGINR